MALKKFPPAKIRLRRTVTRKLRVGVHFFAANVGLILLGLLGACSTVPENKFKKSEWPKNAYIGDPGFAYEVLGQVKTRVDYNALDFEHDETFLCKNAFAKAAQDLVRFSRENGGDAAIDIRSVVFNMDGTTESFEGPECTDDGAEGQVLAQGVAVRWKRDTAGKASGPIQHDPETAPKRKSDPSRLRKVPKSGPGNATGTTGPVKKPSPIYAPIVQPPPMKQQ